MPTFVKTESSWSSCSNSKVQNAPNAIQFQNQSYFWPIDSNGRLSLSCANKVNRYQLHNFRSRSLCESDRCLDPSLSFFSRKDRLLLEGSRRNNSKLLKLLEEGWPDNIEKVSFELHKWHQYRNEVTQKWGVLCIGDRIVIAKSLRLENLTWIHDGCIGIVHCAQCASHSVFWLGVNAELNHVIERGEVCP